MTAVNNYRIAWVTKVSEDDSTDKDSVDITEWTGNQARSFFDHLTSRWVFQNVKDDTTNWEASIQGGTEKCLIKLPGVNCIGVGGLGMSAETFGTNSELDDLARVSHKMTTTVK